MNMRKINNGLIVFAVINLNFTFAYAISLDPFGPTGVGGTVNSKEITIGSQGKIFELDAFLHIQGQDLNGVYFGEAAQFSFDPLPVELGFNFDYSLSLDSTDLTLNYRFINNSGTKLNGVTFLSYLDADIQSGGTFNESVSVTGSFTGGQSFEVDDASASLPEIIDHLLLNELDNINAFPLGSQGDVAIALAFPLNDLLPGESALIRLLISEDNDSLGNLALTQSDNFPGESTTITYSGQVVPTIVPEPGTGLLILAGIYWMVRRENRNKIFCT